ncbi:MULTISPECIES: DedA family protein [unclassified Rhodococcus (in: high G+C Gram-positive bacteria)]|uniref:DedA family protein n=1 Tax=unclassified Rhodococcus (in: high G+C Gram-positive bacteria) TaxID=192944 RepID=UPI0009EB649E|nr:MULTISPECIES: DedA family protein [unclassified Rhodococcus (in: high G+C Gram-positive bacteria)]
MFLAGSSVLAEGGAMHFVESAGPALVWLIVVSFVFLECAVIVGLFLPGDSLLITAGIGLAAHSSGTSHVWALSAGAFVAAIAGNQVGFMIGKRTGHRLVARKNGKYFNTENLDKVSRLLEKHGFWAVLIARWIPWVRTLCPMVAGAGGMNHRRYTIASTLGALIWAPVLLLVGFYFGAVLDKVSWLFPTVLTLMIVSIVLGTAFGLYQYRKEMKRPIETVEVHDL